MKQIMGLLKEQDSHVMESGKLSRSQFNGIPEEKKRFNKLSMFSTQNTTRWFQGGSSDSEQILCEEIETETETNGRVRGMGEYIDQINEQLEI